MAQYRRKDGSRATRYFEGRPPPSRPWKRDPRPAEALRWLDEVRRDDELGNAHPTDLTVGAQLEEWAALRQPSLGPGTRRVYATVTALSEPLWSMRLADLRANHVQAWINGLLAAGKAPKTVALARSVLNQAMKAAWQWERIPRNPVTHTTVPSVKPRHERRAWSATDARRFLSASKADPHHALWTLLLYTGMRQGEARALRWEDVDFSASAITVAASLSEDGTVRGPRKTKDKLVIPMVGPLERTLRGMPQPMVCREYVFTRANGQPLTASAVRYAFRAACRQAGLELLAPHELRHTTATLLADAGVPLLTVASILGHTTTNQLRDTYHHGSDEERRRALESLAERLSG